LETRKPDPGCDLWEAEARRLARQLERLGAIDLASPQNWDLHFSDDELAEARGLLGAEVAGERTRLIGLSLGTKQPINDWGDANWRAVLAGLRDPDLTLVLLGGAEDRARSDGVTAAWPGRTVNLCGRLSPRVSAAMLRSIPVFLCHDSGPMHLAAAVGACCVAVFSRRNPPGMWFPFGTRHEILYPTAHDATIHAIRPPQVIAAAMDAIGVMRAAA
jgi:ADP-heptose:LPS heptosyltransferase